MPFTRNHGIEKDESAYLVAFSEEIVMTAHVLGEDSDGAMRAIFGHIGLGYQHLRNRDAALWIRERLEKYKVESKGLFFCILTGCFIFIQDKQFSGEVKVSMLRQMVQAELFERFLGKRF
ncbi:hypothetical protein PsorP6_003643 [Peronosclerospora sorghi]|uniref:Uncharacterized protein n=1 Tax=Peronosclerospora sorghi TaxID=230839 RepID=A0ACC0VLP3_9STRA|nr:hypothetical protein PsorP6_003643 [Peronosclerospora sorghi]